jgi:lipoate-protein ligase A
MRCFINHENDVFYNFAVEEYFVEHYTEPIFILWKNNPNVMVGRNQNTYAEINEEFCKENNIDVVRRLSGGGAVYSSPENFQYTLILDKDEHAQVSFESLAKPLIAFLKTLGIDAEFTGRNDILIDGKKVSGNAQYHNKNILLHHGTILFDVDIDQLTKSLTPDLTKLTAKGIKSIRSRITTIKERLDEEMTVDEFIKAFMNYQLNSSDENYTKALSLHEKKEILKIKENRWDQWSWNYGKNPKFSNTKKKKFDSGLVEINYEVEKGVLSHIKIYGDFFSDLPIEALEEKMIGVDFDKAAIQKKLKDLSVNNYINGITSKDFVQLLVN